MSITSWLLTHRFRVGSSPAREQTRLGRELTRTWQQPRPAAEPVGPTAPVAAPAPAPPPPSLGSAMALLYLPTLRGAAPLVVVEGVGVEYSARQRLVVCGELAASTPVGAGPPAASGG